MFSHNYGKHSRLNHKVYGCIKKTGCHTPRCYPIHSSKSCSQWVHCMLTVFFRLSQALWTDRAWTSRVFRRRYASNKMLAGSSNSILNPLPSYFANVGMGGYFNPFFNGQSSANHALLRDCPKVYGVILFAMTLRIATFGTAINTFALDVVELIRVFNSHFDLWLILGCLWVL